MGRQCDADNGNVDENSYGAAQIMPECELSDWGQWSSCSASCGKGFEIRKRHYLSRGVKKKCQVSEHQIHDDITPITCIFNRPYVVRSWKRKEAAGPPIVVVISEMVVAQMLGEMAKKTKSMAQSHYSAISMTIIDIVIWRVLVTNWTIIYRQSVEYRTGPISHPAWGRVAARVLASA